MRIEYEALLLSLQPALEDCTSPAEVAALTVPVFRPFGIQYVASIRVPLQPAGRLAPATTVEAAFSTFPSGWLESNHPPEGAGGNPILDELRSTTRSFTWREAWSRRLPATEAKVFTETAGAIGVSDGFVTPLARQGAVVPAVIMAGNSPSLDMAARSALTLASFAIHRRIAAIEAGSSFRTIHLTERERQCLAWAAAGKSDWEIGQIIALSAKTVNYHIENAKRKSGVQTRVQAIVEAMRHGMIA